MNVVTWNPYRNFNQTFNRHPSYSTELRDSAKATEWQPLVDIYEADEKYMVRTELPGVDKVCPLPPIDVTPVKVVIFGCTAVVRVAEMLVAAMDPILDMF